MLVGSIIKGLDAQARRQWVTRQAYIALGNLLTSVALLGIDACPMEGFEPEKYNAILGLPEKGLAAVVLCPVGYRATGDKYASAKKVRFPLEQVIIEI
jgi:nitroreductase